MSVRWIIVDDVDTRIKYNSTSWFPDQGSQDSIGTYGPPYRSTLHGTKVSASLSFTFKGTQVQVLGTNIVTNNSGVLDPTWECFIDNINIGASTTFLNPENKWTFCSQNTLLDGQHLLTVNATVKNTTFWFDAVQFVPSDSVPLDQEAIVVESQDSQLIYSQGWQSLAPSVPNMNMTLVSGSKLDFNFTGISLAWYGFSPDGLYGGPPLDASQATYSIDGQQPISFQLPASTSNSFFQQKFFETAQFPAGPHTLEAVYLGSNSTPLTLEYLIIQNGTQSSTTTSVASHSTTTGASGASTTMKSSTPGIVGGVIGGLALVVFLILCFLFLRRRRKRVVSSVFTPRPFDSTPLHPSSSTPNDAVSSDISYSQVPQTAQLGNSVTHATKGHTHGLSSSSSGVASHTTNLHSSPSTVNKSLLPSLFSPSSGRSASPLSSETGREGEVVAALRPQRRGDAVGSIRSNDTRVLLHEDSGIRMPPSTPTTSALLEVPPMYTAN